jgi:hypothetical protein
MTTTAILLIIAAAILVVFLLDSHKQTKYNKHMNQKLKNELDNLIAETKGKFFSITFVKKDGSVRVINGKDKYQRLLAGSNAPSHAQKAGYVSFVNRNKESWASAHPELVVHFKCGKMERVLQ